MRFRILPVLLIAIGLGVLLGNLGVIPATDVREFMRVWWPAFLIAIGVAALLRPRHHWHHHRHDGDARVCRREPQATPASTGERA